jgi:hypothetical protein
MLLCRLDHHHVVAVLVFTNEARLNCMQVYLHLKHFGQLLPVFNQILQCFLLIPREGSFGYVW